MLWEPKDRPRAPYM
ncbi:hypothetical protein PDE_03820 [Penicillium oxalicum 114-2]|uniref:Uncharacterized protein n=1 Tax=Penicillium oxalicum (strain 114-2 / CGMCC 5302) TaxID=933388 RepID=S7ZF34_PENO1|nr:hypothetical protein PDE_03820 [Penicillium oxalicum 114-2]